MLMVSFANSLRHWGKHTCSEIGWAQDDGVDSSALDAENELIDGTPSAANYVPELDPGVDEEDECWGMRRM